jgi:cytochrome o ubiquinol oxidase operon protein cyoD
MSNLNNDNKEINFGTTPKTLPSYIIGFILCIILTLIPFAVVAKRTLPMEWIAFILAACAIIQLLVQTYCFLRLNFSKDGIENTLSFLFVLFVALVIVGGSMWIMYHMNYNMMH